MSAAHTPGPWIYGEASNAVITPRGHLIASLDDRHPDDEAATGADARLIAAAPRLAEALRVLVQTCETAQAGAFCNGVTADNGVDEGEVRTREWIDRARAALTAAGVTP